jgi:hypothetical protein
MMSPTPLDIKIIENCKNWVLQHIPHIESLLQSEFNISLEVREKILNEGGDIYARFPFQIKNDLYSNPFCHLWKDLEPDNLAENMEVNKFLVEKTDGSIVPCHYAFSSSHILIDPLFGQFLDLDEAISAHPNLFVGRILVATWDQIKDSFGIEYVFA